MARKYPDNEIMAKKPKALKPGDPGFVMGKDQPGQWTLSKAITHGPNSIRQPEASPTMASQRPNIVSTVQRDARNVAAALTPTDQQAGMAGASMLQGMAGLARRATAERPPPTGGMGGMNVSSGAASFAGNMMSRVLGSVPVAQNRPQQMAVDTPRVGMGDVRYSERQMPATAAPVPSAFPRPQVGAPMEVDLPPVRRAVAARPIAPAGTLDPLPFNYDKAQQRARGDYARALHSDSQGLDPATREARIATIRDREDVRDAYAMQDRPVQKQLTPEQNTGNYNALRGQMFGQLNGELEAMTKQRAALDGQPLTPEIANQRQLMDQQIAAKRSQIEGAVGRWSDLSTRTRTVDGVTMPEADARTAGQTRLRDRQLADRAEGDQRVAAYQNREQYGRNMEDTFRRRQVAETIAESRAREAGSNAEAARSGAVVANQGRDPMSGEERLDNAKAKIYEEILGSPEARDAVFGQARRELGVARGTPEDVAAAGGQLESVINRIGTSGGGFKLIPGDAGLVGRGNSDRLSGLADVFEAIIGKLEAYSGDNPDMVSAEALKALEAAPTWITESDAGTVFGFGDQSVVDRLNTIGPRLRRAAGL